MGIQVHNHIVKKVRERRLYKVDSILDENCIHLYKSIKGIKLIKEDLKVLWINKENTLDIVDLLCLLKEETLFLGKEVYVNREDQINNRKNQVQITKVIKSYS